MRTENIDNLITHAQAAALKGCSITFLRWLINQKKLENVEIAGRGFLRRSEVIAYEPARKGRKKGEGKRL
jgi:hypothetical protein